MSRDVILFYCMERSELVHKSCLCIIGIEGGGGTVDLHWQSLIFVVILKFLVNMAKKHRQCVSHLMPRETRVN